MSKVEQILGEAAAALEAVEEFGGALGPEVPAAAAIGSLIVRIVTAGVKAHQTVTGQPLDLSLLHHIEPLPEETPGG